MAIYTKILEQFFSYSFQLADAKTQIHLAKERFGILLSHFHAQSKEKKQNNAFFKQLLPGYMLTSYR